MIQITVSRPIVLFPPFKRNNKKPKNFPPDVFRLFLFCSCPRTKPFSSPMVHKRQFPQKQAIKKIPRSFVRGILWCTMWEQTRTLLFVRAASASHDCSPGSDAVVPPREDKRGVLKYQGAFAAYPRSTNWAAVFHSPLDISPFLFFWLIAEQPTSPYPDWIT